MSNFKHLIVMAISFSLISCSYIGTSSVLPSRKTQYLDARSIPPLSIPPGVSSSAFHNEYPVSDQNFPGPKNVSLVPPSL